MEVSNCVLPLGNGVDFSPVNPQIDQIHIEDIARSLSKLCRFAGHLERFYSVAQHSCYVADIVHERLKDNRAALAALIHDAAESYIIDLPTPLKQLPEMAGYRRIEWHLQKLINERFKVKFRAFVLAKDIKQADREMCCAEAQQLMLVPPTWAEGEPVRVIHECFAPEQAERVFLELFEVYGGKR